MKCQAPLHLQDIVISTASMGNIRTLGQVHITRRGAVRGDVHCHELRIEGRLDGSATVTNHLRVLQSAVMDADVRAHSIMIDVGATCTGRLQLNMSSDR